MKFLIGLFYLVYLAMIISCGAQGDGVAGGPVDTENPVVLTTEPKEFSSIVEKDVVFMFSKPLDESTVANNIFIYPPILNKRVQITNKNVRIKIKEELEVDKNYYFTIKKAIKDHHAVNLDRDYLFVFHSGTLNTNSISGKITFEKNEDRDKPVNLTLKSADSVVIMRQQIKNAQNYEFQNLNKEEFIVEGFVDVNLNSKSDKSIEPYFYQKFQPKLFNIHDIVFFYIDTLKPKIKSAIPQNSNYISVNLSEDIKQLGQISLFSQADTLVDTFNNTKRVIPQQAIEIFAVDLIGKKVDLLVSDIQLKSYMLIADDMLDLKDNLKKSDTTIFKGTAKKDTTAPQIISILPRASSSVDNLEPEIVIEFDRPILTKDFDAYLFGNEDLKRVELTVKKGNSRKFVLTPKQQLINFSTYTLIIDAKDINLNQMATKRTEFVTTKREPIE